MAKKRQKIYLLVCANCRKVLVTRIPPPPCFVAGASKCSVCGYNGYEVYAVDGKLVFSKNADTKAVVEFRTKQSGG